MSPGLTTSKSAMGEFGVGDVLRFRYFLYDHLALCVSRTRVIHYWAGRRKENFIRIDKISYVLKVSKCSDPECYTAELDKWMDVEPFSRNIIVERARQKLNEKNTSSLGRDTTTLIRLKYGGGLNVDSGVFLLDV
ncbi:hypothetical protein CCR75_007837 [Bremia lactucae]|uniref:Uncharacterized protein n=1 Tax=Bremia lactucae TaxID=4779 RepID=A0A976FHH9_BRELC|nr:hypothetical protein CCR75_007837 [Bremia lactucae]